MKKILTVTCGNSTVTCMPLIPSIILMGSTDLHRNYARGITDNPIETGLIADLTGPSGGDVGLSLLNGLTEYTKHINTGGGSFVRSTKRIDEDDRRSIPAFRKLLFKEKTGAFVGPGNGGSVEALCVKIEKTEVPTLSYSPDEFMVKPFKGYAFAPLLLRDDQSISISDFIIKDLQPITINSAIQRHVESGKKTRESAKKKAKWDLAVEGLSTPLKGTSSFDTKGLSSPADDSTTKHKGAYYSKAQKIDSGKAMFFPITDWRKQPEGRTYQ